jgi:hypothetical protein
MTPDNSVRIANMAVHPIWDAHIDLSDEEKSAAFTYMVMLLLPSDQVEHFVQTLRKCMAAKDKERLQA